MKRRSTARTPGYQFLRIKRLDDIIVRAKLQPQDLVKGFSPLAESMMIGNVGGMTDLPAYLVAVNARKHQIQEKKIRLEALEFFQSLFSVVYDLCFKTLLCKIKRNQLCNIVVVVDDQYFLFCGP